MNQLSTTQIVLIAIGAVGAVGLFIASVRDATERKKRRARILASIKDRSAL